MPEVARFFGVVVRMFYDDHNPPHFHAEFGGKKAVMDFLREYPAGRFGFPYGVKIDS